jgi:rRNA-processing protein FCF1
MIRYALDTNIVTYYLKGNKTVIDRVTRETDNKNVILIPPLVFYEINEKHFKYISNLRIVNWA